MKYVLRFLKFIPVIVYSVILGIVWSTNNNGDGTPLPDWPLYVAGVAFIFSCIVIVVHLVNCIKGKYSGREVIIYALLLMIIPVYPCLELILLGVVGLIVPFIGWLLTTVVVVFLYSIVVMTGIIQLGGIVVLVKEHKISHLAAVICGFMSFWFVFDFFVGIFLLIKSFKKVPMVPQGMVPGQGPMMNQY